MASRRSFPQSLFARPAMTRDSQVQRAAIGLQSSSSCGLCSMLVIREEKRRPSDRVSAGPCSVQYVDGAGTMKGDQATEMPTSKPQGSGPGAVRRHDMCGISAATGGHAASARHGTGQWPRCTVRSKKRDHVRSSLRPRRDFQLLRYRASLDSPRSSYRFHCM